ncbi:TatD family hydrolase [Thalassotalea agarivorans]|uniref:Sec-independent protein translocase TatD n=1 Tax=Thalassotalea agarivorans TaxID=349064 RepID=A0A1I0EBZ8_THASX|nr:TatD family hydrolase [Thalassotalea agarivorans]SET41971.1 Sec-independent protein translocase TatD [Thalassotalea agarivorans]
MIDIGVNLTNNRFLKDLPDVVARAQSSGVKAQLVTGTNEAESTAALSLCQQYPTYLYSTAGVHPHDADNVSQQFEQVLKGLAQNTCVKAIGECGLDYNRNFSTPENQRRVFECQVNLAADLSMPLFLHQRDAFDDWMSILQPYLNKVPNMVSHCFTDDTATLEKVLDAGMFVGITGWVCDDKRGQALQDAVKYLPLDRLLIETDAPYLTPKTIRPRPKSSRNEPAYLPYVVEKIAQIKQCSVEEIITRSTENAVRVFGLEDVG